MKTKHYVKKDMSVYENGRIHICFTLEIDIVTKAMVRLNEYMLCYT